MNNLVRLATPSLTRLNDSPLRPFITSNFSLFDGILDGVFDDVKTWSLPYNTIAHDENTFSIEIAMAGFSKDDIEVELVNDVINVRSKTQEAGSPESDNKKQDTYPYYLHRGIAKRAFNLSYKLPAKAKVGEPTFENGLLTIKIEKQIPLAEKPKMLKIK